MNFSSRFAVLKVEDDDYLSDSGDNEQPTLKPKAQPTGSQTKTQNKNKSKKKKKIAANPELQKLAFGTTQLPKNKSTNTKNNKPKAENSDQWLQFVKRDEEFVKDAYETDLQEALLQSQIEYEKKSQETADSAPKKKKKNSQFKKNMSLGDFQNLSVSSPSNSSHLIGVEEDYFENIAKMADDIISKEERTPKTPKNDKPFEAEYVRHVEYQNKLELAEVESTELKKEVVRLKEELEASKTKRKQVIKILCDSETKEKVDLLIQVNYLSKLRDDLNEQIVSLHASYEQERSRVHSLQMELNKYQNKKKVEAKK